MVADNRYSTFRENDSKGQNLPADYILICKNACLKKPYNVDDYYFKNVERMSVNPEYVDFDSLSVFYTAKIPIKQEKYMSSFAKTLKNVLLKYKEVNSKILCNMEVIFISYPFISKIILTTLE